MGKEKIKVLAIIQARLGSTRLPGKVLLPLGQKTVLENVYDRVLSAKEIDQVIVATTIKSGDDRLAEFCKEKGIETFRGSENDLLDRYYQTAKKYGTEHIVRITADCPLIDPGIIHRAVIEHLDKKNDFTCTAFLNSETFPDGEDVDVFTFAALEEAWKNAKIPYQREHVTQYFTANTDKFKISNIEYKENLSSLRWTLDESSDYEFIKAIYKGLDKEGKIFGMKEILRYLSDHPELEKINHQIIRNEGLKKSLSQDKKVFSKINIYENILSEGGEDRSLPEAIFILSGGTEYNKSQGYHSPSYTEVDFTGLVSGGKYRVIAAAEIAKYFDKIKLVTTGKLVTHGQINKKNFPSDARVMADELLSLGVQKNRIILEEDSTSTSGELLEMIKLAWHKGWKRVSVLSSGWHIPRIKLMYDQLEKIEGACDRSEIKIIKAFKNKSEVRFISAEEVIENKSDYYKKLVGKFLKSDDLKKRLALEQKGICDILAGKYKVRR